MDEQHRSCSTHSARRSSCGRARASFFQGAPRDAAAVTLYFSPVFITPDVMLGRKGQSKLKPTDSLALCQLTNNDILYAEWE